MQRREINAANAPKPAGAYTQAVEVAGATRTLYMSGQVPALPDGTVPDDVDEQCRLAWANIVAQLEAAGMTVANIVKYTTILPELGTLAASRKARAAVLGDHKPASTLIVGGLASTSWKIEVEVIACA